MTSVPGAHRQEHGGGSDLAAVRQADDELIVLASDVGDRLHEGEPGPEDPCLVVGLPGQIPSADAPREPQVVADEGAGGRLASDAAPVDHQRAQPLRRAVHRGGQAGGAGAHDDEIELQSGRADRCSGGHGDLCVGGVRQDRAVGEHHDRELEPVAGRGHELAAFGRVGEGEAVRDRTLLEGFPQLVGPTRPGFPDDVDRVRRGRVGLGPLQQQTGDRLVEELVG